MSTCVGGHHVLGTVIPSPSSTLFPEAGSPNPEFTSMTSLTRQLVPGISSLTFEARITGKVCMGSGDSNPHPLASVV